MATQSLDGPMGGSIEHRGRNAGPDGGGDDLVYGFLCFVLDDEEYGVDLRVVRQIVQLPPVTWVPRSKPHVLGVISIRGGVVTLVDTRLLLGLAFSSIPRTARVLLMEIEDELIGLLVDSVTLVRRVAGKDFELNPGLDDNPGTERVIGIARPGGNEQITIIDLVELLAEKMR